MRVKELAAWLAAPWEGEGDREIRRVAPLEDAGEEDLSFVTHGRAAKLATASRAACLLVPDDFVNETSRTVIRTPDPRAAVARAIPKLHLVERDRIRIRKFEFGTLDSFAHDFPAETVS